MDDLKSPIWQFGTKSRHVPLKLDDPRVIYKHIGNNNLRDVSGPVQGLFGYLLGKRSR
jgi:hypothetical protein